MSFREAISTCFSKFADFSGRATRSEYWKFMIFVYVMEALAATIFSVASDGSEISIAYLIISLLFVLPKLSVSVRRLHDIGKSGWFFLISMIPVVGNIIFFIMCLMDSEPRTNKYGPDPKAFRTIMHLQQA